MRQKWANYLENVRVQQAYILLVSLVTSTIVHQYFRYTAPLNDGGLFAAMGQAMNHGQVLYSDIWDNKAPGIFFLNSFFLRIFSDPLVATHAMRFSFIFLLSVFLLFGSHSLQRKTVYSAGLMLLPIWVAISKWEYFMSGSYTEFYGAAFLIISMAFIMRHSSGAAFTAGLFASLAVLSKEPFLFPVLVICIYAYLQFRKNKSKLIPFAIGLLLPVTLFFAYLLANGVTTEYIKYLQFGLHYAGENNSEHQGLILSFFTSFIQKFSLITALFLLGIISVFDSVYQKKYGYVSVLALGIVAATLAFPFLGGIAYGHYFLPWIVAACFMALCGLYWVTYRLSALFAPKRSFILYTFGVLILVMLVFFSASIANTYFIGHLYPQNKKAETEREDFVKLLGHKKTMYVAKEDMGRLYLYNPQKELLRFPCPYYIYFGGDAPTNQQKQNRKQLQQQLTQYQPEVIISGNTWSSGISYAGCIPWVQEHYFPKDSMQTVEGDWIVAWVHR